MKPRLDKLLLALVLAFALSMAQAAAQQIYEVKCSDTPLSEILKEVTRETGYSFVYSNTSVDVTRTVTVSVRSSDINAVLEAVFEGTGISWTLLDRQIALHQKSPREDTSSDAEKTRTVRGRVIDDDDLPLPGADVFVKGTVNGVCTGPDGYYEIEVPDDGQSEANLSAIVDFAEKYPDVQTSVMLVPDAACILSDRLPAFAGVEDQKQLLGVAKQRLGDDVNWIDAVSVLNNHVSDKLYYKTDHHWTTLAAFYVFRESAASLGIDGEVGENFASYTISDDFNGVLASKSGVGLSEKETIDIYVPTQGDDDVVVNYVDEGRKTTSLYDSSKLETRDQYGVFLGGNSSVIDIRTVSPEKKRLLVLKDSFANCFIPFLAPYYREIVVVDPRYYSGTIGDIMDTYRITDALVLYSGNTFFTDNHLSGVLTGE